MKFLSLARPDLRTLIIGVFLVLVATCINMSFPWYLGKIIDVFGAKGDNFFGFTFTQFFIALGLLFVVGSAASGGATTYLRLSGEKIMARVRRTMYANIIRRETAFFDVNTTGDLTSRLLMDVSIVGSALTQNVASGLKALLSGIIGLGMMTYISPSLSLYLAFIAPPTIYISAKYGKYVRKLSLQKQEAYGSLVKEAEERLNAVRTIQAFSTETKEASRFAKRVGDVFGVARREAVATGLFTAGTNISEDAMNIIVLSLGGMMVLHDQMSVGELFSYLFASFYVSDSLQSVGTTYSDIQKGVGAAGRLFPILEESTNAPQDAGKVIKSARGTLTFDNVTFAYPLRPNAPIFRHLSFEVNPGACVAIVARSGQGKSTIASLLLRYYDPQQGSIRINGQDIREYSLKSWRDQVAIVSQEPTLFSGSVGDNITYAIDGPVSMDEVRDVAYQASAGFVFDLPHQLDTDVGNRGTQMSGGMKQRIAIARALLKKPSIMILDEATSALDAASEQEINRVFKRLSHEGNKTIIIIAHKLSTIRSADVVVVLGEDGSLAEIGSFDDLSRRKDSAFNKLMASEFYGEHHEESESPLTPPPSP